MERESWGPPGREDFLAHKYGCGNPEESDELPWHDSRTHGAHSSFWNNYISSTRPVCMGPGSDQRYAHSSNCNSNSQPLYLYDYIWGPQKSIPELFTKCFWVEQLAKKQCSFSLKWTLADSHTYNTTHVFACQKTGSPTNFRAELIHFLPFPWG